VSWEEFERIAGAIRANTQGEQQPGAVKNGQALLMVHGRLVDVYGVVPYNALRRKTMTVTSRHQQRPARKIERIEARLNPDQRRRIEYAARLRGTSISDFIVTSADDAAAQTIRQHEVWVLADRDREVFVKALLHPPAPSARMRAAAKRYKERIGAS
jgi:uncharacterized protein (DUF1778 family)